MGSEVDRSVIGMIMEQSKDATVIKKASVVKSTSTEPIITEETQSSTNNGTEDEQLPLILANAHIPVVSNPKFEFVPYQ